MAGPWLHNEVGLWFVAILALIGLTLYWWLTMWFLLSAWISWLALFPSAVTTAIFWVGMEVVFAIIFSGTVISDDKKYGLIGVVFALMSWLIAIGVVIILGAVVGLVWRERDLSFSPRLPVDFSTIGPRWEGCVRCGRWRWCGREWCPARTHWQQCHAHALRARRQ